MDPSEIFKQMTEDFAGKMQKGVNTKMEIPPKCFYDMEGEFGEYEKGKSLTCHFPVLEKQTNPAGFMQGGYIAAAFDNTFGPFSFLLAKNPTATIDMNVQYIRPVRQGIRVTVEVKLVAKGFTTLAMAGEMKDERGRLLATSQTNLLVFKM